MKILSSLVLLCAVLFGGYYYSEFDRLPFLSRGKPRSYEAVFPKALKLSFLIRLDELPGDIHIKNFLFDVNWRGVPYLFHRNRLVSFDPARRGSVRMLFVRGVDKIDRFAWVGDALLMVWGKRLGVLAESGFETLSQLPEEGMQIKTVNGRQVYLYGGGSGSLYVYDINRGLVHLIRAPAPVGAVSGNGTLTFLAMDDGIYLFSPGKPLSLAYRAAEKVTSLAMVPPSGLFYSTEKRVGYIYDKGKGYSFLKGKGAELLTRKDDLYLFFRDEGVMKVGPVSAFEQFAKSLETASAN